MSEVQRGPRKRKLLSFTQRDVARAIRAAASAGVSIARIRISRNGDIDIVPGQHEPSDERDAAPEND